MSEIATAIRVMAATAQEWGNELGMTVCSLDVKQASDKVTPESLRQAMERAGNQPGFGRGTRCIPLHM